MKVFILECGAGLGLVLILRWYWWRINAWSEISATLAPFIGYSIGKWILEPNMNISFIDNKGTYLFTVLFTTVAWISVTFLTQPTDEKILLSFYKKVKPSGVWKKFTKKHQLKTYSLNGWLIITWLSSTLMIYGILFLIGAILFKGKPEILLYGILSASMAFLAYFSFKRSNFTW